MIEAYKLIHRRIAAADMRLIAPNRSLYFDDQGPATYKGLLYG